MKQLRLVLAAVGVLVAKVSLAQPRPSAAAPSAPSASAAAPSAAPSAGAQGLSAAQVVANMQAFYDRTTDFEADFQQRSRNRLAGTERQLNGHVRFRRGGRMRWDYASPQGDVIVSDGTRLWAYEAAAHQAVQSTLQQSQLPSALAFLMGTGRLENDFTFRLMAPSEANYPGGHVLEARPRTPNASFDRILFYVEGRNFQVAKTTVIDAQGNFNSFVFTAPRVNMNTPETVFRWTPPAGTQIVRP